MKLMSGLILSSVIMLGAASTAAAQDVAPQQQGARQGPPGQRGGGGPGGRGGGGPTAPAEGGTVGMVDSVSPASLTVLTATGVTVTVVRAPSTTYRKGASRISARAIKKGESVLVFGMVSLAMEGGKTQPTISASQVIVQPPGAAASATVSTTAAGGFRARDPSKQNGLTPVRTLGRPYPDQGPSLSGTEADKAAEGALAAYTGGVVNRVTKINENVYEVHNSGVVWPHDIFVDQDFKYLGAR
jgi:hypothetical protein